MPPIILTLLQALFLILLYVFVARAVRAVLRDVQTAAPVGRTVPAARPAPRQARSPAARSPREAVRGRARGTPGELVVHTAGGRPQVVRLDSQDVTFGRASGATVVLDDPYVSERHARVHHDGRDWVVSDLGSTNGTFLNQVKVTSPTPIAPGDQLGVGRTVVEVRR